MKITQAYPLGQLNRLWLSRSPSSLLNVRRNTCISCSWSGLSRGFTRSFTTARVIGRIRTDVEPFSCVISVTMSSFGCAFIHRMSRLRTVLPVFDAALRPIVQPSCLIVTTATWSTSLFLLKRSHHENAVVITNHPL